MSHDDAEEHEPVDVDPDDEGADKDVPPGAPGRSDTPAGDTDQLSDAPSPPAQTR